MGGSLSPARLWSVVIIIKFLRHQQQAKGLTRRVWLGRLAARWPHHARSRVPVREAAWMKCLQPQEEAETPGKWCLAASPKSDRSPTAQRALVLSSVPLVSVLCQLSM